MYTSKSQKYSESAHQFSISACFPCFLMDFLSFSCLENVTVIFQVFPYFQSHWEPCKIRPVVKSCHLFIFKTRVSVATPEDGQVERRRKRRPPLTTKPNLIREKCDKRYQNNSLFIEECLFMLHDKPKASNELAVVHFWKRCRYF